MLLKTIAGLSVLLAAVLFPFGEYSVWLLPLLFGGLYLAGKTDRINEIFVTVMEELYGI